MGNPFDDPAGRYFALANAAGQYSLWPVQLDVPAGWTVAHGPADRQSCLDHVSEHWTALGVAGNDGTPS